MSSQRSPISPAILYWGTPVVLISTLNPDGTANLAPMSSAFWLGHSCMLGLEATSQTTQNLLRTKQCVLNLPSDNMQDAVNSLARVTGADPLPESKLARGYRLVKDKFGASGLAPMKSKLVGAPGVEECPVVMEAELVDRREMFDGQPFQGAVLVLEVKIVNVSVHEKLRLHGHKNRIDADAWKPMIMMFCDLYGVREGKLAKSKLAEINEEMYRPFTGTIVGLENGEETVESSPAGTVESNGQ